MANEATQVTTATADVPAKEKPAEVTPVTTQGAGIVETKSSETSEKQPAASMVTEVKAEDKTPEAKTETAKDAVPEKYKLTLPEGTKLGADAVAKIETLAKEKGWSNERAQEAVSDRHAWEVEREQAQSQAIANLNDKTWKDELMSDPDIGGQKFEQSGHLAFKGAEWLFGKEGAEQLKAMKLNHHPMLFRGLVKLGRENQQDKVVVLNNQTNSGKVPKEQAMYPNMFKKES